MHVFHAVSASIDGTTELNNLFVEQQFAAAGCLVSVQRFADVFPVQTFAQLPPAWYKDDLLPCAS